MLELIVCRIPRSIRLIVALAFTFLGCTLHPATTVFFSSAQAIALAASGTTSDTYRTEGYLFTVTRDKLFTGGVGMTEPIGRYIRVPWPDGMEAQAVTSGPNLSKATITIRRIDGETFAIPAFTVKLLANTGGAGAALEIMPLLNGEDGLPDPVMFNVTGNYGISFSFTSTRMTDFDTYKVTLYVDYALTKLTITDAASAPPPPPKLQLLHLGGTSFQLSWPVNGHTYWLDSSAGLIPFAWVQSQLPVSIEGGDNVVRLNLTSPQQFFRLSD